jgi:hypothetical protein
MQQTIKSTLSKIVLLTSSIALLCLVLLHFFSPEFEPNWRMVSEYALGSYKWMVSLFFIFWGLSSIILATHLWRIVNTKASKAGVVLLFISGIGASLAAFFDVSQPAGHGLAALLGIPTVPIATLLITYHLSKRQELFAFARPVKLLSHGTWISLVLMVVAMMVMISGFQKAGIEMGPDSQPPAAVPDGVIALAGYVNRLLIIVDILWLVFMAIAINNISKLKPSIQ